MSQHSNSSNGRTWIEGTLDVISGVGSNSSKRVSMTSPLGFLKRLPSQDSLDRSIHNDSGHGKSTAEIIRDLKQSNARLTAKTAELEADFMNELNQNKRQFEEQRKQIEERLAQKEKHVSTLETRCKSMEERFRGKEQQLANLKEESAFQRHTISDLKTQLHEMEQGGVPESKSNDALLQHEIARLQHQLDLAASPDSSQKSGENSPGSSWKQLERTQDALRRTELALANLQTEQKHIEAQHAKRVMDLKEELAVSNADWKMRESILKAQISDLRNQDTSILERDDEITRLREQVLDYSAQLTELTEHLAKSRASAESQEQYRREEADDLRVLNDAQEEEIAMLRQQLEEAVREIELRENEIDKSTRRSSTNDEDGEALSSLQDELEKARESNKRLNLQLEKTRGETAMFVADLQAKIAALEEEKTALPSGSNDQKVRELKSLLASSEEEKELMENEYRRKIAKLQQEIKFQEGEVQARLDDHSQFGRQGSSAGESTNDSGRVAALEAELQRLRSSSTRSLHQSGGSLEEDLRKELQSVKAARDMLQSELLDLKRNSIAEVDELENKLEDRDTTISALVKTSVMYEEQIETAQAEIALLRAETGREIGDSDVDVIMARGDSTLKKEVTEMRRSIEAYRTREEQLSEEIYRLDNELTASKRLITRLRFASISGEKDSFASDEQEIQERDDAIANLLKKTISQDKVVADLQEKLLSVSMEMESGSDKGLPSWEEVQQLREEAEVFAGQVIELDEEIDSLKAEVAARDARLAELEQEVKNARTIAPRNTDSSAKIMDLEAEIDELVEANSTQQEELRQLRRKARDFEFFEDEITTVRKELYDAKKEADALKQEVIQATREKELLENRLSNDDATGSLKEQLLSATKAQKLAEDSVTELQAQLARQKVELEKLQKAQDSPSATVDKIELDALRTKLSDQSAAVASAKDTIRELENMLAERNSADAAAFEEMKEELLAENDSLSKQLEEAQKQLVIIEQERGIIEDFKEKLEVADEARASSEKSIVDNYERKLSLLKLDKDVTIDKLRNELAAEKEANAEDREEAAAEIEHYKVQFNDLKEEMEAELQQRETKVFALEHTLDAQQQLVKNMRVEMDHLQSSMENAIAGRRDEVEEMQKELSELTLSNAKQEREIKALRTELEEKKLEHQDEVTQLKERIKSLEESAHPSEHRDASDLKMELRMQEVKDRLEKLKWLNTSLKEENEALRERLGKTVDRAQEGEQKRSEVAQLKETISGQDDRIRDLQYELDILRASPIIVGPQYPEKPPSLAKDRSPRRGFLGRRLRSNSVDVPRDHNPPKR